MPRKLYKNVDASPSLETPPGAGEPQSAKEKALARMAETKRNVKKHVAEGRAESKRRANEPKVSVSEMSDAEAEALSHDLEADFEAASDRFIEAEDRLRSEPTIENAKVVEVAREEAQELHDASEEVLPKGGKRRKSKATLEREARHAEHQANVNELISDYVEGERGKRAEMDASVLEEEKADNLKRMQEMGGVWGGESYFVLSERNEEIDAKLNKLRRKSPEKKAAKAEELSPATEEALVLGDLTPEDRVADARKTIDFMNAYEQEIAARQKTVRAELKKYGIKDAAQIDDVLSEMSPELREKSIGLDPGLWYKIRKMARNLAGMERPPEVKELLQKYAELENEMNEQLHKRREAEAELAAAHAAAGSTPSRRTIGSAQMRSIERRAMIGHPENTGVGTDVSAIGNLLPKTPGQMRVEQELESLKNIEQGSLQKELAAVRAMKMMEEEIQDAMLNITRRRDNEIDLGDAKMYKDKFEGLYRRVRALKDEMGDSKEGDEALHAAEAALAQYNELIDRRLASQRALSEQFSQSVRAADEQSKREREAGRARPMSVIGSRDGQSGTYGTSKEARRVVRLSQGETSDSFERRKAQEQREAEELREKVNREIQNYRSIKWRKELIDSINQNENVRAAMHSLYDSFKGRALELQNAGAELGQLQTSPDPALDYALNLYRLHATKPDGKFVYGDQLRDAAAGALIDAEEVLGSEWDANGLEQRFKAAMSAEQVSAAEPEVEVDVEVEAPVQGIPGVPSELIAQLPEELRTEAKAVAFAYRSLNRDERGSLTKPWVIKQILRRLESKNESDAEKIYDAFHPDEGAEPIPLTRLKRATSEYEQEEIELNEADLEEIPQMQTLSLEEMTGRLKQVDRSTLTAAKKIIGLVGKKVKAENIANQYGILVGMASNGSSAARERIMKLHELLKISFDGSQETVIPLADADVEVIEGPPLAEVIDLAQARAAKNKRKSA